MPFRPLTLLERDGLLALVNLFGSDVPAHNAGALGNSLGRRAIGRVLLTHQVGAWMGGVAVIIEVTPDPGAPEIVFTVRRLADLEAMGIFEAEVVGLYPEFIRVLP